MICPGSGPKVTHSLDFSDWVEPGPPQSGQWVAVANLCDDVIVQHVSYIGRLGGFSGEPDCRMSMPSRWNWVIDSLSARLRWRNSESSNSLEACPTWLSHWLQPIARLPPRGTLSLLCNHVRNLTALLLRHSFYGTTDPIYVFRRLEALSTICYEIRTHPKFKEKYDGSCFCNAVRF